MPRGHEELLRRAARRLLREKGLSRTTARDLVAASGTNLNSIGYHFGGKDALMAGALSEVYDEWVRLPTAAAEAHAAEPPEQQLAAAVRTMLADLGGKRGDFLGFLSAVGEVDHDEALAVTLRRLSAAALEAVSAQVATATGLPPAVAGNVARIIVALHDGLALQATIAADPAELAPVDDLVAALAGVGVTLAAALEVPGADRVAAAMVELAQPGESSP